jgi:6,7-dimethyl-8-ribityllumazine synthase
VRTFRGQRRAVGRRIGIVASEFNEPVTVKLVEGALACLAKHEVGDGGVDLAWVPGAFELPLVARAMASSGGYDAVVCLGTVIRGETAHFQLVAEQAARGIAEVAMSTDVPVAFGVLATETLEQALERAGGRHGNKGWDAAAAALEMASVLESLPKGE